MEDYTRETDPRVLRYFRQIPKWVVTNQRYKNYLFKVGDFETLEEFKQNRQEEINHESSHNRHR